MENLRYEERLERLLVGLMHLGRRRARSDSLEAFKTINGQYDKEHHCHLASTELYCLVTEAHWCEQLAKGCCTALSEGSQTCNLLITSSGRVRNFHLGAVAQEVWGMEVPLWGPGRQSPPEAEAVCSQCLQIFTGETIDIRNCVIK